MYIYISYVKKKKKNKERIWEKYAIYYYYKININKLIIYDIGIRGGGRYGLFVRLYSLVSIYYTVHNYNIMRIIIQSKKV